MAKMVCLRINKNKKKGSKIQLKTHRSLCADAVGEEGRRERIEVRLGNLFAFCCIFKCFIVTHLSVLCENTSTFVVVIVVQKNDLKANHKIHTAGGMMAAVVVMFCGAQL